MEIVKGAFEKFKKACGCVTTNFYTDASQTTVAEPGVYDRCPAHIDAAEMTLTLTEALEISKAKPTITPQTATAFSPSPPSKPEAPEPQQTTAQMEALEARKQARLAGSNGNGAQRPMTRPSTKPSSAHHGIRLVNPMGGSNSVALSKLAKSAGARSPAMDIDEVAEDPRVTHLLEEVMPLAADDEVV